MIAFFITIQAFSQTTPENKLGAWYMIDGNHQISNRISIKTGLQLRSYELADNINLMFYYGGVNYHMKNNVIFTLAYCFLDIDKTFLTTGESHLYENRIYEQIYIKKTASLPINHRIRVENRFFNYQNNQKTKHRLRYRIGSKIKLNKTFSVSASNEFFANFTGPIFNENRFQVCLGIKISKGNSLKVGYLNHEIFNMNLNRLQLGYYFKTNWVSKTKS